MEKYKRIFAGTIGLTLMIPAAFSSASNSEQSRLKPFPLAEEGMQRQVILLPAKSDETGLKVELIIGKEMMVDCNRTLLIGDIQQKTISGWGYDYYTVAVKPDMISTKMACPAGSKTNKFVNLASASGQALLNYTSRLPLVIYTPKDISVKYRIWSASNKISTANKG